MDRLLAPYVRDIGSSPVPATIDVWCNGNIDGSNPFDVGSTPTASAIADWCNWQHIWL